MRFLRSIAAYGSLLSSGSPVLTYQGHFSCLQFRTIETPTFSLQRMPRPLLQTHHRYVGGSFRTCKRVCLCIAVNCLRFPLSPFFHGFLSSTYDFPFLVFYSVTIMWPPVTFYNIIPKKGCFICIAFGFLLFFNFPKNEGQTDCEFHKWNRNNKIVKDYCSYYLKIIPALLKIPNHQDDRNPSEHHRFRAKSVMTLIDHCGREISPALIKIILIPR